MRNINKYMQTSVKFNLTKYILLEYIYNIANETYSTVQVPFRKIENLYTGELTVVNTSNAKHITKNTIDDTVVELDNGKFVLLDIDTGYFYPNLDPNINVIDSYISQPVYVKFDKVRIHLLSGYNFDDIKGFLFSIFLKSAENKKIRLNNILFNYSQSDLLYFNPRPIKLAEFVFDRYIEFLVPSLDYMLQAQINNPNSPINPAFVITGYNLSSQPNIFAEFKTITGVERDNGIDLINVGETKNVLFNASDNFGLLIPRLKRANDGDYFEFYGEYDGEVIENFIYKLNSIAGNNYYIIHDVRLIEQVDNSFYTTDEWSQLQTTDFDKILKYKPIIEYGHRCVAFSIEYTLRLYNKDDGRSIFKTASYTFTDIPNFGKKNIQLPLQGNAQPLKIYNKVSARPILDIKDNILNLTKTKMLSTFYDASQIVIKSENDLDNSANVLIQINPFDNVIKFDLVYDEVGTLSVVKLDTISEYYMVFTKLDGTKYRIAEFINEQFNKTNGELAFKISQYDSDKIRKLDNRTFYITSKQPDGIETVIFSGQWTTN